MSYQKSYAKAFYESNAKSSSQEQLIASTVRISRELSSLMEQSKELRVLIESPATTIQEKETILSSILKKGGASEEAITWINLIARNDRASHLAEIANELEAIYSQSQGKLVGEVVSAEWVEEGELKALSQSFEKKMGKPVFLRQSKDSTLLAGLKVTIGGLTYDGTLRSQLNRLKERFIEFKMKGMN